METLYQYLNRKRPEGKWKQTDTYINGRCIFPGHNDRTSSFGVSIHNGDAKCFVCGRLSFVQVVQMLEGCSLMKAMNIARSVLLEPDHKVAQAAKYERNEDILWHPYWRDRGLSTTTIAKYHLSYTEEEMGGRARGWGMIPVDDGKTGFVGECLRAIDPDSTIRYKYTKGMLAREHIWGAAYLPSFPETLYVTEGIINALSQCQVGLDTVSTLGSGLSRIQIGLIKKIPARRVVFIVEPDKSGLQYADKVMKFFPNSLLGVMDGEYKDANDMLKDTGSVVVRTMGRFEFLGFDRRKKETPGWAM